MVCDPGGQALCAPNISPGSQTEVCDGLDNDCNGMLDENGVCAGACVTAMDCPGQDTECQYRTCTQGVCGFTFQATGTPTGSQVSGDCANSVCDGAGGIILVSNNSDVPPSDGNQCTNEVCINGNPAYQNLPSGTPCTQNGGTVCDGNGACVSNAACGDGLVQGPEACDDANQINGDGCSATCTVEPGYSCAGSPSVCTTGNCMDGIKNGTETGVDCGGGSCPACGIGQGCNMASECLSGVCSGGVCVSN